MKRRIAGLAAATYLASIVTVPVVPVAADSSFTSTGGGTIAGSVSVTSVGQAFADLPGWKLAFSDEFSTSIARGSFASAAAGRYFAYPNPWKDTSRNGTYSPEIIAVENGVLDVAIATVNSVHKVAAFSPLPDGRLSSHGDLAGMRVEFRLRADRMVGYKGVPLLWPMSGNWPWDGEINFPESNFDGSPMAFMHRQDATTGSDQDWYRTPTGTSWQDWHDYVVEWVPGVRSEFFLDGASIGRSTSRVPETAMHLVMQFETQVSGGAPSDSVSGHVQIDRLAVWAMTAGATPTPAATPQPTPTPTPGATPAPGATPSPGATPAPGATPTSGATATPRATATTVRYGDSSQRITYSAGWSTARHGSYADGAVHFSTTRNATATLQFTGSAVTWLGPKGPTRGKASVYVDGKFIRTVDLHATRFHGRPLALFTQTWSRVGTHSLSIRVAGTPGRPVVAVDAFTVRR